MIKPIGARILVEPQTFKEENTTSTGIVYATETNTASDTSKGLVKSVGDEVKYVKNGDEVYYETFGGHEVSVDGERLIVLQEINVVGVIENG